MSSSHSIKKIICIKWGTRYSADYVNRLYAMAARHTSPPFQLYCFTDNTQGIRPEVACRPIPELGCPVPVSSPGKWRKLALWGKSLEDVTGTLLFIDLDSIITGPLDDFFTIGQPDDVYLAKNWAKPLRRLGQTSVFRFTAGASVSAGGIPAGSRTLRQDSPVRAALCDAARQERREVLADRVGASFSTALPGRVAAALRASGRASQACEDCHVSRRELRSRRCLRRAHDGI